MDDAAGPPELGPDELRTALRSSDPAARAAALDRAARAPEVEEVVRWSFSDPDQDVRRAAVRALARVAGPRAAGMLTQVAANDPSPSVRADAVLALGAIVEARLRDRPG